VTVQSLYLVNRYRYEDNSNKTDGDEKHALVEVFM